MSVTMVIAILGEQAADLTFSVIRQLLQPVGSDILLDNAVGPSLPGFDLNTQ